MARIMTDVSMSLPRSFDAIVQHLEQLIGIVGVVIFVVVVDAEGRHIVIVVTIVGGNEGKRKAYPGYEGAPIDEVSKSAIRAFKILRDTETHEDGVSLIFVIAVS